MERRGGERENTCARNVLPLIAGRDCRTTFLAAALPTNRQTKDHRYCSHVPAHDDLVLPHPQVNRLGISLDRANERHVGIQGRAEQLIGCLGAGRNCDVATMEKEKEKQITIVNRISSLATGFLRVE